MPDTLDGQVKKMTCLLQTSFAAERSFLEAGQGV